MLIEVLIILDAAPIPAPAPAPLFERAHSRIAWQQNGTVFRPGWILVFSVPEFQGGFVVVAAGYIGGKRIRSFLRCLHHNPSMSGD